MIAPEVKATILEELARIEERADVRILFALESGSRGWGFASTDSDYDVRFIYARRPHTYLTIEADRDVLEFPIHDALDISGWDIRKALQLFRKSNPPLLEWLDSPLVYTRCTDFVERLRALREEYFYPVACMHHYLSMARKNYREYLKNERVKVKKYFYVLRPVLACLWIRKYETMPPMEFHKLLDDELPSGELRAAVDGLLERKRAGTEMGEEPRIGAINDFLDSTFTELESHAAAMRGVERPGREKLDALFRATLVAAWDAEQTRFGDLVG